MAAGRQVEINHNTRRVSECGKSSRRSVKDNITWLYTPMTMAGMVITRTKDFKSVVLNVYAICVIVLNAAGLWRFTATLAALETKSFSSSQFVLAIAGITFYTMNSILIIFFYVSNWRGKLTKLLNQFEKEIDADSQIRSEAMGRKIKIGVFLVWVIGFISTMMYVLGAYIGGRVFELLIFYPFGTEFGFTTFTFFVAYLYGIFVWLSALAFVLTVTYFLAVLFQEHRMKLQESIGCSNFNRHVLENSRQRFTDLCELVEKTDSVGAMLNGISYTLNTVLILQFAYNLTYTDYAIASAEGNLMEAIACAFWGMLGFSYLTIGTVSGVYLNNQV